MTVASVQLVLDSEVWKMDALVEVWKVVLSSPFFDLALVAIGSAVAVAPAAIVLLQPFLVFALEFVIEDDATDVGTLFAQPLFFAKIGAIQMGVMRQLPRSTDVRIERSRPLVVAVTAMRLQQMAPRPVNVTARSRPSSETNRTSPSSRRWSRLWSRESNVSSRESRRSRSDTTRNAPTVASDRLSSPFSSYR